MNRKKHAKWLRITRKIHRTMGATLFLLFLLISMTGIILGWKKHSGELIMPPTQKGSSESLREWLPIDSLGNIALFNYHQSEGRQGLIDRLDIRPGKGVVKVIFQDTAEIQLDGKTGKVLSFGMRHSDWIEHLHDGSYFDDALGTDFIKVLFTTIAGISLFMFSVTGFWLWYGPKAMRRATNR